MVERGGGGDAGAHGAVCAGSPYAARAGARVLARGGSAADAAIAACLALAVADPINASLFGRCQILGCDTDGSAWAMDGATQAPRALPAPGDGEPAREGFAAVPVPGLLHALASAHRDHGRLPLSEIVAPAISLAEDGFAIPQHLGEIWREKGSALAADLGARRHFLDGEGRPYGPGDHFRQPALAKLLRRMRDGLTAPFDDPGEGEALAARILAAGGRVTARDLAEIAPREGEIIRTTFRGCEVVTIGRQGWGHSLVEMLNILEAAPWSPRDPHYREALALTILCALHDRPQEIGTLRPKIFGLGFETLVDPAFARERAARIEALLRQEGVAAALSGVFAGAGPSRADRDTSHLSVVDARGGMVSLTTSIGPHFGAGVADEVHGCLFAHSYRMASQPMAGARDVTEMTPTIVMRGKKPFLALGAAGSERIPGAVLQVLVNLLDGGMSLEEAVRAPRIGWSGTGLRAHRDLPQADLGGLASRGYAVALADRGHREHLGIVHAVMRGADGRAAACADPAYDGEGAMAQGLTQSSGAKKV